MANSYYTFTPSFVPGDRARSVDLNNQFASIEAAFDKLPAASDAAVRGTAYLGTESGSGNAYVVAMPNTRTTNKEGDRVLFRATHANTGAITINVDSLGAVSARHYDDSELASGEIESGKYYEFLYDNALSHFLMVGVGETAFMAAAAASAASTAASAASAAATSASAAATSASAASDSADAAAASAAQIAALEVVTAANSGLAGGAALTSSPELTLDVSNLATSANAAVDLDADYVPIGISTTDRRILASAFVTPEIPAVITGTSDTLQESDFGKVLRYSSTSEINVTLPDGLKNGFWCVLVKTGASGDLIVGAATTMQSANSYDTCSTQFGVLTALHLGSNVWHVWGDLESAS